MLALEQVLFLCGYPPTLCVASKTPGKRDVDWLCAKKRFGVSLHCPGFAGLDTVRVLSQIKSAEKDWAFHYAVFYTQICLARSLFLLFLLLLLLLLLLFSSSLPRSFFSSPSISNFFFFSFSSFFFSSSFSSSSSSSAFSSSSSPLSISLPLSLSPPPPPPHVSAPPPPLSISPSPLVPSVQSSF